MRFANIFETIHGQVLTHLVQLGEGQYAMVVAFLSPGGEIPSSVSINFTSLTPELNWLRVKEAFESTTLEVAEELVGNVIEQAETLAKEKLVEKPRIHLLS